MSHNQRLGYQRLAEVLVERGLVEPQAVQDALTMGAHGGLPFPEALVTANLVADWELSRVVCELYGLPFLTVDMADPDPEAQRGLDLDFLRQNGLVPLSRHGRLLTVCMPSVVPAEVLGCLAAESQCQVMPVVGTVQTNRRWLSSHMEPAAALPQDVPDLSGDSGAWSNLFDEADAAVLSDLDLGDVDLDDADGAELELGEPAPLADPAESDELA
ncbi:MAG: hypothetical protein H6828_04930 [Planctomycetes bacterium]|nr:hypothetical protein [Planctomycetota bacterium]